MRSECGFEVAVLENITSSSSIECQCAFKNDPKRRIILRGAVGERSVQDGTAATARLYKRERAFLSREA